MLNGVEDSLGLPRRCGIVIPPEEPETTVAIVVHERTERGDEVRRKRFHGLILQCRAAPSRPVRPQHGGWSSDVVPFRQGRFAWRREEVDE